MSLNLNTRLAAVAASLALLGAGCGDEDADTDATRAPAATGSAPATTTEADQPAEATPPDAAEADGAEQADQPGEATPADAAEAGSAERAVEDALSRIDSVDQNTADSVREAARAFDAERGRAGGSADEAVQRARDSIARAVQDADPRTREQLEDALGQIQDNLTTQGNAGG